MKKRKKKKGKKIKIGDWRKKNETINKIHMNADKKKKTIKYKEKKEEKEEKK